MSRATHTHVYIACNAEIDRTLELTDVFKLSYLRMYYKLY